jgi:hypothetical protein
MAGERFAADTVEGYYVDYRPKIDSYAAHPEEHLYAADIAQLALGWWERLLAADRTAEEPFLALCGDLEREAEVASGALLWPYRTPVAKYGPRDLWYSAMAQGQAASVFVRAFRRTGDERYADLAQRSLLPLLEPGPTGMVASTADGPALEEYGPSDVPSHILNGWIFALWGVRDVAMALADPRAAALEGATTACLAHTLQRYDTGWWSKYSLYPHVIPDLAKPFYHRLHVTQLEILHRLTGLRVFGDTAARWRSFDRRPAAAAAIASKVPFRLANRVATPQGRA